MTEIKKTPAKTTKNVANPAPVAAVVPAVKAVKAKVVKAKVVRAPKAAPVAVVVKEVKVDKHKKEKMVRDSFSMPESDYAQLAAIKERCLKSSVGVKKSEVLRAALKCLAGLSDVELTKAITDLDIIKTGRPAKV